MKIIFELTNEVYPGASAKGWLDSNGKPRIDLTFDLSDKDLFEYFRALGEKKKGDRFFMAKNKAILGSAVKITSEYLRRVYFKSIRKDPSHFEESFQLEPLDMVVKCSIADVRSIVGDDTDNWGWRFQNYTKEHAVIPSFEELEIIEYKGEE